MFKKQKEIMDEFVQVLQIQKTQNFYRLLAFQKILEMFDNLMKFKAALKTILTNFTNVDKFVQFMKIQTEGSF